MPLHRTHWAFSCAEFDPMISDMRAKDFKFKLNDRCFWWGFFPFQRPWSALHCWIASRETRSLLLTMFWWSISRDLKSWCPISSRNAWDILSETPFPSIFHLNPSPNPSPNTLYIALTVVWICIMYILYLLVNMWTWVLFKNVFRFVLFLLRRPNINVLHYSFKYYVPWSLCRLTVQTQHVSCTLSVILYSHNCQGCLRVCLSLWRNIGKKKGSGWYLTNLHLTIVCLWSISTV